MDEKWNNLIILDACRYDSFERMINYFGVKGELRKVMSRGSSTPEFIKENFIGRKFLDTIYITTNPYVYLLARKNFYKVINLWLDNWDDNLDTVPPQVVNKQTLKMKEKYPQKRFIIHYMQPHSPFIGDYRKKGNFWQIALNEGKHEVMEAYESNLKLVLSCVKRLLEDLNGLSVITADHGNACGELATPFKIPIYGHPNGVHIPALIEVPWFVFNRKYEKNE